MHISLPPEMREYVREVMEREGFASESEYVRSLVREDRRRRAKDELDKSLIAGLKSGELREVTPDLWREMQERARRRARSDDAAA